MRQRLQHNLPQKKPPLPHHRPTNTLCRLKGLQIQHHHLPQIPTAPHQRQFLIALLLYQNPARGIIKTKKIRFRNGHPYLAHRNMRSRRGELHAGRTFPIKFITPRRFSLLQFIHSIDQLKAKWPIGTLLAPCRLYHMFPYTSKPPPLEQHSSDPSDTKSCPSGREPADEYVVDNIMDHRFNPNGGLLIAYVGMAMDRLETGGNCRKTYCITLSLAIKIAKRNFYVVIGPLVDRTRPSDGPFDGKTTLKPYRKCLK